MAEAVRHMVIHHAHRLHEGVAHRRPDEAEAQPLQLAAHGLRFHRLGRHVGERAARTVTRHAIDEFPQQRVQRTVALAHGKRRTRVGDRRLDLQPVAHDAGVGHQALDVGRGVTGDLVSVEIVEGAAVVLALLQDRDPAQPRLRTLEHQHLEEVTVVVVGHAPFEVVVGGVERIGAAPGAAVGHGEAPVEGCGDATRSRT